MRVLRLSVSIIALVRIVAGGCVSAQTTTRYPYPAPGATQYPSLYPTPSPYAVQPLSDADRLASEIRLLAADPKSLQALVRAGELALKLDDDTAAGAFFARAERIDPHNGRVKAGEGSLLVAAERPGEALRRFAEAQSYGADPRSFAADRGLAYDLIGEQDRAQRDYRVALQAGPNDETQRRYALSLGISGKRDLALAEIDPLLRRSDRGAWRSRAFILAMSGDRAGAEKIATSMMPSGLSQGLLPFFEVLPTLRPADRAFAVHFGEVRATPERLSDARLVPPLAALAPDPTAPAEVAAVVARPVVVADARKERKSRRKRDQVAAVTTPPPPPLPAPPAYAGQAGSAPVALAATTARVPPGYAPLTVRSMPAPAAIPASLPQVTSVQRPPATASLPVTQPRIVTSPPPVILAVARPPAMAVPPPPAATVPAPVAVVRATPPSPVAVPVVSAATTPPPVAGQSVVAPTPVTEPSTIPPTNVAPGPAPVPVSRPAPTPVRSEESILAAIIADIKVPGSELRAEQRQPIVARIGAAANVAAAPIRVAPVAPDQPADVEQAFAAKIVGDKKIADKKTLTDKKALADRKAADAKRIADAKKAAEEKRRNDPKILEPSRFWVQVSGGANERDLPKQWAKVRTGSKAFGGKGGWTTPLRATNRILTGPFKSESDAQSFVNTIAKDGLSGFVFVSEAGQKIVKLGAK